MTRAGGASKTRITTPTIVAHLPHMLSATNRMQAAAIAQRTGFTCSEDFAATWNSAR